MREIGGYIELDSYRGKMLHEDGIRLNCGRCALEYIIKAHKICKILVPKFMCDSNDKVLQESGVKITYYNIGLNLKPILPKREKNEWLYLVNYYGQLTNEYIKSLGENIIVDNAQAYFQNPIEGLVTVYACRKFFGVSDGAILYSNKTIEVSDQDESFHRMNYLLGRYERSASEFYDEYVENNELFANAKIKKMSKLTENLLRGIDYEFVKGRRTENFLYLHEKLSGINQLELISPVGPFMYPLLISNGEEVRKVLQKNKIYIPTLWPDVFGVCKEDELEFNLAKNILPLPIDQRYSVEEMNYMLDLIMKCVNEV